MYTHSVLFTKTINSLNTLIPKTNVSALYHFSTPRAKEFLKIWKNGTGGCRQRAHTALGQILKPELTKDSDSTRKCPRKRFIFSFLCRNMKKCCCFFDPHPFNVEFRPEGVMLELRISFDLAPVASDYLASLRSYRHVK